LHFTFLIGPFLLFPDTISRHFAFETPTARTHYHTLVICQIAADAFRKIREICGRLFPASNKRAASHF